jgi:hypothetical protein
MGAKNLHFLNAEKFAGKPFLARSFANSPTAPVRKDILVDCSAAFYPYRACSASYKVSM